MFSFVIVYILLLKNKKMGYKVKIQRVERGVTKSFYVNFPAAIAEAGQIEKGEEMEWLIEDKDVYVLKRAKKSKSLINKVKRKIS
jgi:bifunctional DNA-binding transcriptional regulator/antitoxin component of YhaV-PrlF toxin-antitoxin module